MEFYDFDSLSDAGKIEALRAGNSLVISHEQLGDFVQRMGMFLLSGEEHLAVERIGILSENRVYTVCVIPALQYRKAE